MYDLTRFKDIFGKPKEGVHRYRIFGMALVDLGLTVGAAFLLSVYFKWNFFVTFLGLMVLSIGVHGLFGVNTTLMKFFGLSKEVRGV